MPQKNRKNTPPAPVRAKTAAHALRARNSSIEHASALFAPYVSFEQPPKARNRLFGPATTFWLFLWQVLSGNLSCAETVQSALAWLCREEGASASPNTAGYCKARARLEHKALEKVARQVAGDLEARAAPERLWMGRRVRIVDGTGLSMPDTPENQKRFPQSPRQKPGCGFPTMRLVALFSLATGAIAAVAFGSLAHHERTLFHRLWEQLMAGDIALGDRGFCSFADFFLLSRRGVDCVMRNHPRRSSGQRVIKRLGKGDHLVAWRKTGKRPDWLEERTWKEMPKEMTVRQVDLAVEIPGFRSRNITIVTTLLDAKIYSKAPLGELYRRRWLAELFLRDVKISLGMDALKCKSPGMVQKELMMHLIAYNLVRTLMLRAAQSAGTPDPSRISFKRTADALRQWAPHIALAQGDQARALTSALLHAIGRLCVPNRPNRVEPRAIKRRRKNYQLLNKPRKQFKEIPHRNKYKAALS